MLTPFKFQLYHFVDVFSPFLLFLVFFSRFLTCLIDFRPRSDTARLLATAATAAAAAKEKLPAPQVQASEEVLLKICRLVERECRCVMHGKIQSVSQNRRKRLPPLFPTLAPHTFSLTFSTEEAIFGTRKRGERRQRPSEAVSQAIFRTLLLLALDVFILSFPFPFSTPHSLSVIVGNGHTHTPG